MRTFQLGEDIDALREAVHRFAEAEMPLRLCYLASTYRSVTPQRGQLREVAQAGVELIGAGAAAIEAGEDYDDQLVALRVFLDAAYDVVIPAEAHSSRDNSSSEMGVAPKERTLLRFATQVKMSGAGYSSSAGAGAGRPVTGAWL